MFDLSASCRILTEQARDSYCDYGATESKLCSGITFLRVLALETLMRKLRQIPVQSIHLLLILIIVVENDPENATRAESEDGHTRVHPKDLRVDKDRYECLVECRAEGVREKVQALHEGLHARWCFRVGVFQTSDGDEDLGDTDKKVCWGLNDDVDVIR